MTIDDKSDPDARHDHDESRTTSTREGGPGPVDEGGEGGMATREVVPEVAHRHHDD